MLHRTHPYLRALEVQLKVEQRAVDFMAVMMHQFCISLKVIIAKAMQLSHLIALMLP